MQNEPLPLTAYSSEQRQAAMIKYQVIAPYLRSEKNLIAIVEETGIAKRTLRYWIRDYEKFGLKGLIRKTRSDSGKIQLDSEVIVTIEQMILKHRRNSLTSIHRMICEHCHQQSWKLHEIVWLSELNKHKKAIMELIAFLCLPIVQNST